MELWLVERSYDTRNTVTVTYATTDGEHVYQKQSSIEQLAQSPATAGVEREQDALDAVADDKRDRYAAEATRMAEKHELDDEV